MKKTRLSSFILLVGLGTAQLFAQKYIPEDDIYYRPGDKNPVVEQKKKEKAEEEKIHRTIVVNEMLDRQERDVDEYNRRFTVTADSLLQYQEEDVTYTVNNDGQGYYLNGFTGTQSDFEYAERIRRFYNPRFTIHISDPAYANIYFLDSNDWNIYIDHAYAWVTPTWTNPWYWNYTWSPYSYTSWSWRWNHGFGVGWYDPFWGYSPYWGYSSYWRHAPYWGHSPWAPAYGWAGRPYYHNPGPGGWNHAPARPSGIGRSSGYRGTGSAPVRNNGTSAAQATSRGRSASPSTAARSTQAPNTGVNNTGRTATSKTTVRTPAASTQKPTQSRTAVSSSSSSRSTSGNGRSSGSGTYNSSSRSNSSSYGNSSSYSRTSGSSSSGRSSGASGGGGASRRGR